MSSRAKQVRDSLKKGLKKSGAPSSKDLLSTGVTTLDLACSDRIVGALAKGHYYHFVGDSGAGKTFIVHSIFAEACRNVNFSKHRLIYDSPEGGAIFDKAKFFGSRAADRIEEPSGGDSYYIENFYDSLSDLNDAGVPYIYILDSESALSSKAEEDKDTEHRAARMALDKKEVKGSYGDGKAKYHSSHLRGVVAKLKKIGSILVIVSQTRDNIGFGSQFNPKVYGGGKALKFYCTLQIWFAVKGKLMSGAIKGKKRQQGITAAAHIVKNRVSGKDRWVEFPIYHSVGIDDIGSCVDYLIEEGHWKEKKGIITAPEFEAEADRETLIHTIEEEGQEKALQITVLEVWQSIEEASRIHRKPRYE